MKHLRIYYLLLLLAFGCGDYWTPSHFPATVALSEDLTNRQKANIIEACMQWNAAVETEVFEIINYNGGSKAGLILFTRETPRPGAFASTYIYRTRAQIHIGSTDYVGVLKHELLHTLGYRHHDKDKSSVIYSTYLGEQQKILPIHIKYIKDHMPDLKDDEKAPVGRNVQTVFQGLYNNSINYKSPTPQEPMKIKIKSNQVRDRIYNLGGHDISFNYEGVGYINAAFRVEIEKALLLQQGFFTIIDELPVAAPIDLSSTVADTTIDHNDSVLNRMFGANADLTANFTLLLAESGYDTIDQAYEAYCKQENIEAVPYVVQPSEDTEELDTEPSTEELEEEEAPEEEYEEEEEEQLPEDIVDVEIQKLEMAATPVDPQPKRGRGRPRKHPEPDGGSYYMKNKKKKKGKKK